MTVHVFYPFLHYPKCFQQRSNSENSVILFKVTAGLNLSSVADLWGNNSQRVREEVVKNERILCKLNSNTSSHLCTFPSQQDRFYSVRCGCLTMQ